MLPWSCMFLMFILKFSPFKKFILEYIHNVAIENKKHSKNQMRHRLGHVCSQVLFSKVTLSLSGFLNGTSQTTEKYFERLKLFEISNHFL